MIASIAEIEKFLSEFHQKVQVFDIIFLDERDKNLDSLAKLDITPNARKEIIKTITVTDYSEGPIRNLLNSLGDLWVFGKDVNDQEVYIKISYGLPNHSTICISFHPAEHPMNYPYRNREKKGGKQ